MNNASDHAVRELIFNFTWGSIGLTKQGNMPFYGVAYRGLMRQGG
jgi:hypothetical protein